MNKNKHKILREMFESGNLTRSVGAHDGLGAKLIGESGFDAVWASGLEISASYGVPDANILTMSQFLAKAYEMNQATTLPIIADCDTGFGNVNNAIYMMEQYEAHGISGICIEDKTFPKVNSFIEGRQDLASIDEFVGKIKAINDTKKDKNIVLIARVEALIAGWGMDEALKRSYAYENAGADAILIHSKKQEPTEIIEFVKIFRKKSKKPIVIVPTTYVNFSEKEIKRFGINHVIYANQLVRTRVSSQRNVLNILNNHKKLSSIENKIAPLKDILKICGLYELNRNENIYNSKNYLNTNVIIPAAGIPNKSVKIEISDKPTSFVEVINKKTLIDINLNTLKSLNLKNINIITGFKKEFFNKIDCKKTFNKNFKNSSLTESILLGLDDQSEQNLVIFSDIFFEKDVIDKILKSENDITFIISEIQNKKINDKLTDGIIAKNKPIRDGRYLTNHKINEILEITKEDKKDINFEFSGIFLLSKNGTEIFKKAYLNLKNRKKSYNFINIVNHIIKSKLSKIYAIETYGGWVEIKNKKNLSMAKNHIERYFG